MLTVHTVYNTKSKLEAPDYIAEHFNDSKMLFAYDAALTSVSDMYFTLLGGTNSYPRTVIIDENGIIAFTKDGAVNHAKLVEVIEGIKAAR